MRAEARRYSALMLAAQITLPHYLRFVGDELAKVGGRERERVATQVGKPRLDLVGVESRATRLTRSEMAASSGCSARTGCRGSNSGLIGYLSRKCRLVRRLMVEDS